MPMNSLFSLNDLSPPESLKNCCSPELLAIFLGFDSYEELSRLIYPDTNKLYRNFHIPKKNGNSRRIDAPKNNLKEIQKVILRELDKIYKPKNSAHGFIKERSIVTNASQHINKKFILNIDLKDFFNTISFARIRKLFIKTHSLTLESSTATVLAQLCCHNGMLPQGAPTSPIISNMICYKLDSELKALATKHRCTYTRYVDDITFSFTQSRGRLPKDIVSLKKDNQLFIGAVLRQIIKNNGFGIQEDKSRITSREQRQEVTGLTVNDRVNVTREYIRQTASMLYAWKKFGLEKSEEKYLSTFHKKTIFEKHQRKIDEKKGEFFKRIVKGRINYIKMVRGDEDIIYRKLAYNLTDALGKPNLKYKKTAHDIVADSTFIIHDSMEDCYGTAFLLDGVGLITNFHVVDKINKDNVCILRIFRHDETETNRKVQLIKSDKEKDLAIFKPTKDFNGIKRLKIGDDTNIKVGDKITVIGFPDYGEGDTPHIDSGKVTQSKKRFENKIWVIDIPVIQGNSGGPVVNEKNEVIGIATYGSKKHDYSTSFHGFIPISALSDYAKENT
jgi:RNA-directed DNA polymerase